eukprot:8009528-Pyramimonas_sp.AAC.1
MTRVLRPELTSAERDKTELDKTERKGKEEYEMKIEVRRRERGEEAGGRSRWVVRLLATFAAGV